MPTASILTFGCKVNQYDSNTIYDTMVRSGYEIVDPEKNADICVVNTCTVTNSADQKARQIIRRIIRKNPQAKIIVTGCYAESDRQAINAIPGVSLVFGNREKTEFQRYLNMINNKKLLQIEPIAHDAVREHANFSIGISSSGDRTRAIVKVQDGCSAFCSSQGPRYFINFHRFPAVVHFALCAKPKNEIAFCNAVLSFLLIR